MKTLSFLLSMHISKQEKRRSCRSLVLTTLYKMCFLLGWFLIYAKVRMAQAAGEPESKPQSLCWQEVLWSFLEGVREMFSWSIFYHMVAIKKSSQKLCTNKYHFPMRCNISVNLTLYLEVLHSVQNLAGTLCNIEWEHFSFSMNTICCIWTFPFNPTALIFWVFTGS